MRCWPAVGLCAVGLPGRRFARRWAWAGAVPWWPADGAGPRPLRGPGRVLRGGGLPCRGRGRGSFAAGASAAVGLAGSFAVVACLAGVACAGAAGVAAGFSRGQGPGLGSALLAMVRFRGAARGPLRSAVRCALSCMGRAAGVRPAGGKQQSYKYSKKSMSRKHQSQHPLTTTRNFSSSFPESLSG